MSKIIIGVTGPSNGGKSTFCKVFERFGFTHINADEIYHSLLNSGTYNEEFKKAFGDDIFTDESVDRKKLAKIVFNDKAKLAKLGEITHRKVDDEIKRLIDLSEKIVLDIPLLYECGVDLNCNEIFAVVAKREILIKRAMLRDGIDENAATVRIDNQKAREFYEKNGAIIISNDKSEDEFISEVMKIVRRYK